MINKFNIILLLYYKIFEYNFYCIIHFIMETTKKEKQHFITINANDLLLYISFRKYVKKENKHKHTYKKLVNIHL